MLAQLRRLRRVDFCFIVEGDNPCGAQNGLAQPAHSEQQKQDADRELQKVERNTIEQRPERQDDERKQREPRNCPKPGGTPAANGADGKHDRQRLDRLDERTEKCSGDGRRGHGPGHHQPHSR